MIVIGVEEDLNVIIIGKPRIAYEFPRRLMSATPVC